MRTSATLGPSGRPVAPITAWHGSQNSVLRVVGSHPLLSFFVLTYTLSWAYEVLLFVVLRVPMLPWAIPMPLLGPTLSALLVTYAAEGKPGLLRFLRRLVLWRVGIQWYLFAIFGILALAWGSYLIVPESRAAFQFPDPAAMLTFVGMYAGMLIFAGPLFEEIGWRGFALSRLQQRWGPLVGSLILGVLWAFWHTPLFLLVPGYDGAGEGLINIAIAFAGFAFWVICFTIILTWVFNNTQGSILLAVLVHNYNAAYAILHPTTLTLISQDICFGALALLIVTATRGQLSYGRYCREMEPVAVDAEASLHGGAMKEIQAL